MSIKVSREGITTNFVEILTSEKISTILNEIISSHPKFEIGIKIIQNVKAKLGEIRF